MSAGQCLFRFLLQRLRQVCCGALLALIDVALSLPARSASEGSPEKTRVTLFPRWRFGPVFLRKIDARTTSKLALPVVLILLARAAEADIDPDEAVRGAARALARQSDIPWYDRDRDSIRQVVQPPQPDPHDANRSSGWTWNSGRARRPPDLPIVGILTQMLQQLVWVFLGVLVVLLVIALVWAFVRKERKAASAARVDEAHDRQSQVDRVEHLPFELSRPSADLLSEARRHYQQGNYREAIIYLFSYQLVYLDRHHLIRLTKGKTNRQYLGEIRAWPGLQQMLQGTMIRFEEVFFGRKEIDRARFEISWNGLDTFHQLVEKSAG